MNSNIPISNPKNNLKHSRSNNDDSSDAKRWLIIGAHQAGASEKRVARISGLSKTAVRHIILNYQRTGNPSLPKREPKKVKERPLVEYDEEGNLIISEDEEDYDNDDDSNSTCTSSSKKLTSTKKRQINKLNSQVTAKDLIEFMMEQVKQMDREDTPLPTSYSNRKYHQDTWYSDGPSSNTINHHLPSFLPLSPVSSGNNKSSSNTPTPTPTPSNQISCGKYDQTIRGYELWTENDDVMLLQHVLTRLQLGNWRELEAKFQGRHTARLCNARWSYLRTHLLKGIDQADTSLWQT